MHRVITNSYTAFDGQEHLLTGSPEDVAVVVKRVVEDEAAGQILVFDNATGRVVDIDIRGPENELRAQLAYLSTQSRTEDTGAVNPATEKPRGRGRPKLGVVAREVTLLPRHWIWLASQPGGASVALRKLVEQARKASTERDQTRAANERAYHFMSALAGDFPGFEEATRALFAGDQSKFAEQTNGWPSDIRNHASWLAFGRVRV